MEQKPHRAVVCTDLFADSFVFILSQAPDDPFGEHLVNLPVSRDWLRSSSSGVVVDVMLAAVPDHHATVLFQPSDEFTRFPVRLLF